MLESGRAMRRIRGTPDVITTGRADEGCVSLLRLVGRMRCLWDPPGASVFSAQMAWLQTQDGSWSGFLLTASCLQLWPSWTSHVPANYRLQ